MVEGDAGGSGGRATDLLIMGKRRSMSYMPPMVYGTVCRGVWVMENASDV